MTHFACHSRKLMSCFQAPFQDLRNWIRPSMSASDDDVLRATGGGGDGEMLSTASGGSIFYGHHSPLPSTRSEYSFRRAYSTSTSSPSASPTLSLPLECINVVAEPYISYIDEASTQVFFIIYYVG